MRLGVMDDKDRTTRKDQAPRLGDYFPPSLKQWIGAAAIFAVVAVISAGALVTSGVEDIGAYAPHPQGWAGLLHFAFGRYVSAHAETSAPPDPLDTPELIATGASVYANECANCHGAPGYGQNPVALSMRPEPPSLDKAWRKYSAAELFTIIHRGAAYTAMPAWPVPDRPDEIWSLVAFLKHWPQLDAGSYRDLAGIAPSALPDEAGSAETAPAPIVDERPVHEATSRPYMPGDPQSIEADEATTLTPRTGMAPFGMTAGARCEMCHGENGDGKRANTAPRLDIQSPAYLLASLRAYAAGQRRSGIMWPYTANLSEADMRALARHLGAPETDDAVAEAPGIPAPAAPQAVEITASPAQETAAQETALLQRGRTIAEDGIGLDDAKSGHGEPVVKRVAACASCHGVEGASPALMPRLAGQNPYFLRNQLRSMRGEGRGANGAYNPMNKEAHGLADEDIRAVAAWYASLPPGSDMPKRQQAARKG